MNCICCYDEKKLIKCNNCETYICINCLETQLNISYTEIKVPKCVICKKKFLLSFIDKTIPKIKNLYIDLLYKFLMKKYEYYFNIQKAKKELIDKVIEKRQNIINTFPSSIQLIIELALRSKINKVHKSNYESITNDIESLITPCINSNCSGKLKNDTCVLCDSKFCLDCEKIIKKTNNYFHECSISDLESIKLVRDDSVPCPQCNVRIHKIDGCNELTCVMCQFHFNYRDPKLPSVGNHGKNINFEYKGIKSVRDIRPFVNSKECEYINKILLNEVKSVDFTNYLNRSKLQLAKIYEDYKNLKKYNKVYNKICINIQARYLNETLNLERLKKYNAILINSKKEFGLL